MGIGYNRLYDQEDETEFAKYTLSWKRLHQCNAKLSTTSEMASLMSFFAVAAAVDLKLVEGETTESLIIALVVCTCALVATTMIAKTVTCSIIPYIESVVSACEIRDVSRSPHEEMIFIINTTWLLSTTISPFLFVVDLIIMIWIKFEFFTEQAVYGAMIVLLPLLVIILGFGVVLFRQMLKPDKTCVSLYKCHQEQNRDELHVYRKRNNDSESTRLSFARTSSRSSDDNYWEDRKYLLGNQYNTHASYGSTLISNPVVYYGILE